MPGDMPSTDASGMGAATKQSMIQAAAGQAAAVAPAAEGVLLGVTAAGGTGARAGNAVVRAGGSAGKAAAQTSKAVNANTLTQVNKVMTTQTSRTALNSGVARSDRLAAVRAQLPQSPQNTISQVGIPTPTTGPAMNPSTTTMGSFGRGFREIQQNLPEIFDFFGF